MTVVAQAMSTRGRAALKKVPGVQTAVRRLRQRGGPSGQVHQRQRARLDRQAKQIDGLRRRVAQLETEVQECRRLNKRVAEVTDLVAEVLMPAAHRDDDELRRRLDVYAETL